MPQDIADTKSKRRQLKDVNKQNLYNVDKAKYRYFESLTSRDVDKNNFVWNVADVPTIKWSQT